VKANSKYPYLGFQTRARARVKATENSTGCFYRVRKLVTSRVGLIRRPHLIQCLYK